MTSRFGRATRIFGIGATCLTIAVADPVMASFERPTGGARPMGLEGAVAGYVTGCDAAAYNPGGLAQSGGMELAATFSRLYMGLSDNSNLSNGGFIFCSPVKKEKLEYGTWAIGMNSFALQNYYSESEAGVYYGKRIDRRMSVGGGLKYLSIGYGRDEYSGINPVLSGQTTKSNISADIGIMAFPVERLSVGLSLKDINGPDMGLKYSDPVAQKISLGGAYRFPAAAIVAGVQSQRDTLRFAFGGEYWFLAKRVGARAACGIGNRNYADIGAGFSYRSGKITIDYALNYPLSGISGTYGTHVMSFGYAFTTVDMSEIPEMDKKKKEAAEAYERAVKQVGRSEYEAAAVSSARAAELVPGEDKYVELAERLATVLPSAGAVMESRAAGSDSARKGLKVYASGEDPKNAIDLLVYAYSVDAGNGGAEAMAKAIGKEEKMRVPDFTEGWNFAQQKLSVALERFKEKKYYECIKLCEESLYLEPGNPVAYKRMGSAFFMLKNREKARENWQKAIRYAPDDADAQKTQQLINQLDRKQGNGEGKLP